MKRIKRWLTDFFEPGSFNNLDTVSIGEAFNDPSVRAFWLNDCFETLKQINLDVDKRLLSGSEMGLTDLCARRKAYQDVLEAVLTARRQVAGKQQDVRHNPRIGAGSVNLDRVTA